MPPGPHCRRWAHRARTGLPPAPSWRRGPRRRPPSRAGAPLEGHGHLVPDARGPRRDRRRRRRRPGRRTTASRAVLRPRPLAGGGRHGRRPWYAVAARGPAAGLAGRPATRSTRSHGRPRRMGHPAGVGRGRGGGARTGTRGAASRGRDDRGRRRTVRRGVRRPALHRARRRGHLLDGGSGLRGGVRTRRSRSGDRPGPCYSSPLPRAPRRCRRPGCAGWRMARRGLSRR